MSEVAVQAVVGVLPNRTGVEDDDVCGGVLGCTRVPSILQQTGQALESWTFIWQP